jgi:hypothetical protein
MSQRLEVCVCVCVGIILLVGGDCLFLYSFRLCVCVVIDYFSCVWVCFAASADRERGSGIELQEWRPPNALLGKCTAGTANGTPECTPE